MDINQIIAQTLAGPQVPGVTLDTGNPIIARDTMSNLMTRALAPDTQQLTPDDKSMAIAKIGLALMAPRMPGESVAGNIAKSVNTGLDYATAAKERNLKNTMAQAALGSTVNAQDTQTRMANAKLQQMQALFPLEMAEAQQRLKKAALDNDVATYNALKSRLLSDPENLMKEIGLEMRGKEAGVKKIEAEGNEAQAKAGFYESYGKAIENGEKGKIYSTKTDDGSVLNTYRDKDGKVTHELVRPGISDQQQAMKMAEKMLKKENNYGIFGGPTPKDIAARAAELMKPKTIRFNEEGQLVTDQAPSPTNSGQPAAPSSPSPAGFPKESTEEARSRAGLALKRAQEELGKLKEGGADADTIASKERDIARLQTTSTAENPHETAIAKNPEKTKKEIWTPDKLKEVLSGKTSAAPQVGGGKEESSPEGQAVDAARAKYDAATAKLKEFGLANRKRNPEAIKKVKDEIKAARKELDDAQSKYESSVGNLKAVTGRTMTK